MLSRSWNEGNGTICPKQKDLNSHKHPLPSDSEDKVIQLQLQSKKACRPLVSVESEPDSDVSKQSTSNLSDIEESKNEPAESIAKSFFGEVPAVAGSCQKKPHGRKLTAASPSSSLRSSSKTPPLPIWGSQLKSLRVKERKCAVETPMWDPIMTSSCFGSQGPTAHTGRDNRSSSSESVLRTRMVLTYGYSIRVIGQGRFKASAYTEVQWFLRQV
ncbi:hypothetical protein DFJ58DRAFT_739071 [Suillus subalutaceus]|uniref:uncharacterized protein n=1 Tax=Suillus subalutaceus TaxID=48586 RepID=UPI001B866C60|nr:uncharacterized protein DFJ58DRAFT_739071 [Suillus subalutaceus]KAG1822147.1 hypothetical protein DFJ58DRAFT_739071 [Suillus subalutaceus]